MLTAAMTFRNGAFKTGILYLMSLDSNGKP
jgi:hypothetical protein